MTRIACVLMVCAMLPMAGISATAQVVPVPGPSAPPPPQPAPPPPPSLEVPQVPRMNNPPPAPKTAPQRQSFNRRVNACIDEAAAYGIDAGGRAAYARACITQ